MVLALVALRVSIVGIHRYARGGRLAVRRQHASIHDQWPTRFALAGDLGPPGEMLGRRTPDHHQPIVPLVPPYAWRQGVEGVLGLQPNQAGYAGCAAQISRQSQKLPAIPAVFLCLKHVHCLLMQEGRHEMARVLTACAYISPEPIL